MDINLILDHPLAEYEPLKLLENGGALPIGALGLVVGWSDAIAKTIVDGGLLAPRDPMHILRGMTASLTGLAAKSFELIKEDFSTYTAREHEAPAALLMAMDLVIRQRGQLVVNANLAKEIAARRQWKTVEDVTGSLLQMEAKVVRHGNAVLRHHAMLREQFAADDDNRSFDDTQSDIRRRLDFIAAEPFKPLFDASNRTVRIVEEAETISREANVFRQSREASREASVMVTYRRNVLFTAWNLTLSTLQDTLLGALEDDHPDRIAQVEAKYWRSLASMGRKARKPTPEEMAADESPDEEAIETIGETGDEVGEG
jgi:hypothetical protein